MLDVTGIDLLLVSLIEESEALTGLLSISVLLNVSVGYAELKEFVLEMSSLQEVWIMLSNLIVNFLWG